MQPEALNETILSHLQTFDEGIAPTLNDIVSALLVEHTQWSAHEIATPSSHSMNRVP